MRVAKYVHMDTKMKTNTRHKRKHIYTKMKAKYICMYLNPIRKHMDTNKKANTFAI